MNLNLFDNIDFKDSQAFSDIYSASLESLDISKSSLLKQLLIEKYNLAITRKQLTEIIHYRIVYELRDIHPDVFNTPLLGVNLAHFLPKDQAMLFGIFETDRHEFERDLEKCPAINQEFKVISDAYNIFSLWVIHCIIHCDSPVSLKQDAMKAIFVLLQYKFFTSVVNYNLPHKANVDVMTATVDGLSLKYDIKKPETSTWKTLVEAKSVDIISKASIHYNTLDLFAPDGKVLYIISDIQTRLRSNLVRIIQEYYTNKANGVKISSFSMVDEIDGEKIIKNLACTYDVMVENILNQVLNTSRFIRHDYINLVCQLSTNIRPDMMRDLLIKFSDLAVTQYQRHEQQAVIGSGANEIYVGYNILITQIIQKTYRAAILDKVDLKSKIAILDKSRNIYRSSRIADIDILKIKNSVEYFVDKYSGSNRESTNASLKIGLLLYLISLSFDYLN